VEPPSEDPTSADLPSIENPHNHISRIIFKYDIRPVHILLGKISVFLWPVTAYHALETTSVYSTFCK
jgi:hypothetical protein